MSVLCLPVSTQYSATIACEVIADIVSKPGLRLTVENCTRQLYSFIVRDVISIKISVILTGSFRNNEDFVIKERACSLTKNTRVG